MTISSTDRKAGPYNGNGVTTAFPFEFKVFAASEVVVVSTDPDGAETILTLATHYTVALNANQNSDPGGTVNMLVAPATDYLLTLTSNVANLQPVDLTNNGGFYPKVINDAIDRLTILAQQNSEQIGRAVKVQISSSVTPASLIAQIAADVAAASDASTAAAASAASAAVDAATVALFPGPSGSENVGHTPDGIGAASSSVKDALDSGVLYIKRFGAVGDGVTDDTVIVTGAHVHANTVGAAVSYAGINSIALQANAQIPIKTSVDFAGCEIAILGGVEVAPSFSAFNTLYSVSDDSCPLVNVVGSVTSANLVEGAVFPTLGLFDGHGYAKLSCALQVPDRAKTGTQNYTQSFKVNRVGRVSHPLSTDVSAHAAAITVDYRKTSTKRLTLNNLNVQEGAWNNQRIFYIERCNVAVSNFTVLFAAPGTFDNVCELISIKDSSDIAITGFVTTGRPVTTTVGSYCLAINGGADIYVDGMNALTGWGAVGSNDVNGLHFMCSVINRIDSHSSGHNIFADDCDLHESGVIYGWGGGIIAVKNSRAYRCPVISKRTDYGGSFFGSLVVDAVEVSYNSTSTYTAIDLATNALGASSAVYAPKSIEVSNLRRTGKASANNAELIPVAIKILDAASVVYAPARVKVADVGCAFPSWRFGMRLDVLNMEANPASTTMRILVAGAYPDAAANGSASVLTTGILDYDSVRTPTSAVRPSLKVSDADQIAIRMRSAANLDMRLTNVNVNAIVVDTASVTQPTVILDVCKLLTPAAGFTTAPIGGNTSGASGHTVLKGCEIAGLFDLSLAAALIGNTIRTGANQPTLPATVTALQAFEGWRKSGVFS